MSKDIILEIQGKSPIDLSFGQKRDIDLNIGRATGTTNYERLGNKPLINGVELIGDRSIEDLGVETLTNMQIQEIFNRVFRGG